MKRLARKPNSPQQLDALELLKFRAGVWLLPIGASALAMSWFILGDQNSALDRYAELPLAAALLLIHLALLRFWIHPSVVIMLGVWLVSLYLMASLAFETAQNDRYVGLSPSGCWLVTTYVFAYVMLNLKRPILFSVAYFAACAVALSIGIANAPRVDSWVLNGWIQMMLAMFSAIAILTLSSQLRGRYVAFKHMAFSDELTQLANRRLAEESMREKMVPLSVSDPYCVMLIDVDHFKLINDRLGHHVGDQVLQQLARVLNANIRQGDLLARWGGEEFILLAPRLARNEATTFAERLRSAVSDRVFVGDIKVTISIGIAICRNSDSANSLLRRADKALYRAKSNGRDRVEIDALDQSLASNRSEVSS